MSQKIANASPQFDFAISPELLKALAPEFSRAIKDAIEADRISANGTDDEERRVRSN
ncbi:hypothetical protein [Pectobacterium carotovorum]|uniref:hypothetical protein n=1 Tax=Pectobacterium carotovorum TaxID=554 RepID=UPI0021C3ABEA|nr:hypothetical protein [Pectobacterium carotovorum]